LRFWREQGGATAIEYGLIVAGISIIIIAAVNGLGPNLSSKFDSIRNDESTLSALSGPGSLLARQRLAVVIPDVPPLLDLEILGQLGYQR
jgi:pilus assembly protein Flp/PilA